MKKISVFIVVGIFFYSSFSYAKPIDKDKALKAANTFLVVRYPASDANAALTITKKGQSALKVKKEVMPLIVSSKLVGYVVDLEPAGFILFSGDDEMPPVKIYSDTGSYNGLPEGLQWVLELELLEDNTTVTSPSKKNRHVLLKTKRFSDHWSYLTSDVNQNGAESFPTGTPGTTILTTTWHQNDPYNFYAPAATGGPGGRAWAGCTATALAQVLRHRSFPSSVTSNHTYVDNFGTCQGTHSISDAGMGAYDWANMPASISTSSPNAQKQAVGQLIYHCGVALESNYEAGATSAFPSSVPSVLRTYFNYTCGDYLQKSSYTDAQWYAKIENDIDNDRPAFYAMWEADWTDGHAVVCDGYRNGNEIHLDLGWSGAWTAWYNMDSVVANGYTWTIHGAVFNITPAVNQAPILSNPSVSPPSGTTSTNFEFLVDYYDADGDPPDNDYKRIYLSDGRIVPTSLKSGTESDGTYHYTTTLPQGSYSYMFFFADEHGLCDITNWYNGPYVHQSGNCAINIHISVPYVNEDLELRYSLNGLNGPFTTIPITASELELVVPIGNPVTFTAGSNNPNYSYAGWDIWEHGNHSGGLSNTWSYTPTYDSLSLDVQYDYTPQYYTISGTVLKKDGSLVPSGVALMLTSPEQTISQNTTNGNWSFTGVKGGVSVTITLSASGGYEFSPPKLIYNNLKQNWNSQAVVVYASDYITPETLLLSMPPAISEDSTISFSWSGSDNVTAPANLMYQYKLDSVDADWSSWSSGTSKSYDVNNGAYTFWVRAKDEAGNINQAPVSYKFAVNAAPKVISAERIKNSIWASRITLQMPAESSHPTDKFVLLPQHSGINDSELVPVRIHYVDDVNARGANAIVAGQLGLTTRITQAGIGWLVTLPQSIPSGQTAQYDIVWGKMKYFGWQEFVGIPLNFKSEGLQIQDNYLAPSFDLWRLATKNVTIGAIYGDTKSWTFMNITNANGSVLNQTIFQFYSGIPFDGTYGEKYTLQNGDVIPVGQNIFVAAGLEKHTKNKSGGITTYHDYEGYALSVFAVDGTQINSVSGPLLENTLIRWPLSIAHDRLYVTGHTYDFTANTTNIWFVTYDSEGRILIPQTTFETMSHSNSTNLHPNGVIPLGSNIVFLFEHSWAAAEDSYRTTVKYQVRDRQGNLLKATTNLCPPLLPDSDSHDDYYYISRSLTDKEGKLWISLCRSTQGQSDRYYYVILGTNGAIWKGPVQTSALREFVFCDKDGYIWATENGQFLALNPDDTTAVAPRTEAWTPNQDMGLIAASAGSTGYRLYDRWSPQPVQIDAPSCANRNTMELFDLNLWNNALHPANLNLKKGDASVWSQSGQFTGYTTVNMSGVLNEGQNLLTITQDDFLGGQVLATFPYVLSIVGDITGNGIVDFEDLAILADQWLQPPGNPSADIAPQPNGDGIVNFLDFALMAENWMK